MAEEKYKFLLSTSHALLLDGAVDAESQAVIDKIKLSFSFQEWGLSERDARFVSSVVEEAKTNKRIKFCRVWIRKCHICGKAGGYYIFQRGRRRGKPDFDRPLDFAGFDLGDRLFSMKGAANLGGCVECWERLKEPVAKALATTEAEIDELITGMPPRWLRCPEMKCSKCGWTGAESRMGRARTLLGDGWFPSTCPNCPARNEFGRTEIERTGQWLLEESPKPPDGTKPEEDTQP